MKNRHVALLRGINVGGKNSLPMAALKELFEKAGCSEVATYIQSGNVVFTAAPEVAKGLGLKLAAAIEKHAGFKVPVVLRSAEALAAAAKANPFLKAKVDENELLLMFLADAPAPSDVDALDPKRSPPDSFAVLGAEVYLRCPSGYGQSKLTNAYFDSKLKTVSTVRNWRTVLKLIALSNG